MPTRKNFPERKLKRKAEAEARQKQFDALPPAEKARRRGWTETELREIGEEVSNATGK